MITITACAPTMKVPVTRPAEINLHGSTKIAIGEIRGDGGQFISDLLTSKLFETGKFEIVDRANVDRIMKEHKLNLSGAVDEKTAPQLGKLVGAEVLVFGNVSTYKYDVHKSTGKPRTDSKGKPSVTYQVKGLSRVTLSFQVVNLATGVVLAAKTISRESEKENTGNEAWPSEPDRDAVMGASAHDAVTIFVRMITPSTEYVEVTFARRDSDIPELERGINFARIGQWKDAVDQFKIATEKNPSHQGAFWNLGLAYEYSTQFDKAEESFRKADNIKPCEKCIKEIANVRRLAEERRKLDEQGALKMR